MALFAMGLMHAAGGKGGTAFPPGYGAPHDPAIYDFKRDTSRMFLHFPDLTSGAIPYIPGAAKAGIYAQKVKDQVLNMNPNYARIDAYVDQMEANTIEANLQQATATASARAARSAQLAERLLQDIDRLHHLIKYERVLARENHTSDDDPLVQDKLMRLMPLVPVPEGDSTHLWPFGNGKPLYSDPLNWNLDTSSKENKLINQYKNIEQAKYLH